jgi:hypothetical protein
LFDAVVIAILAALVAEALRHGDPATAREMAADDPQDVLAE